MAFDSEYREKEPTREEIERSKGLLVVEFGANWCRHCQALSPTVETLLNANPQVQHVRIADGRGKPLGRSFRVKLWPTVVLMRDGQVVSQLVRPTASELEEQFEPFSRADAAGN